MRLLSSAILASCLVFPLPGLLSAKPDHHKDTKQEPAMPKMGIAILNPTKGNKARGMLKLVQQGEDLKITGKVRNLSPGKHGFHIHMFGDLRAADGTSAGGHFDPFGHEHGAPNEKSHLGDLGNITANEQGVAEVDIVSKNTVLPFVLGRSFVVHAGQDDLKSQPSGDSGPRVAVGVIGVGNPDYKSGSKKK